jgi:hypothetical protein
MFSRFRCDEVRTAYMIGQREEGSHAEEASIVKSNEINWTGPLI